MYSILACGRATGECVEKKRALFYALKAVFGGGMSALQFTGISGEASMRKKNLCGGCSHAGNFFFCVGRTKYADVELGRKAEGRQSPQ
jgi:hypothetical protein